MTFDFRPGGVFHYAMQFQPGHEMFGRFVYREIAAPERHRVHQFVLGYRGRHHARAVPAAQGYVAAGGAQHADADRRERQNNTDAAWPAQSMHRKTETKTFIGMFDSMKQGFGGTFDKLDELSRYITELRHIRNSANHFSQTRIGDNTMTIALIVLAVVAAAVIGLLHLRVDRSPTPSASSARPSSTCRREKIVQHPHRPSPRRRMVALRERADHEENIQRSGYRCRLGTGMGRRHARSAPANFTIADVTPSKIIFNLDMTEPMKANNIVEYSFEPQGDATRMTWSIHGRA